MLRTEPVIGRPGTAFAPVAGAARPASARDRLALPMRRLRRPLSWLLLGLSAFVHIALVAVLLLARPTPPVEDGLGAPSVSVLLTPDAENPASPTPTPEAALGQKDAPTVQRDRAPEAASAPAVAASPPIPPPPSPRTAATPEVSAVKPPPAATAPPPPAPPAVSSRPSAVADATAPPSVKPIAPTPPAPQPPALVPRTPAPVPPPVREALLQPRLPRPAETPQASPPTSAQPTPAPAPPRPSRPFVPTRPTPRQPENPSGFPAPLFSSLGGTFGQSASRPTAPSREMPGPVRASSSSAFRPQYDLSGDDLGAGWERQFSDWVNAHKFYPREAAENGEEGDVAVKLVINHAGQVMGVTLLQRSGSQWLDEALEALFRGQRLPALPESYGSGSATENVLMHYILIHR